MWIYHYLGFIIADAVDSKASLHIVDQTEILICLLNGDHVYNNGKGKKNNQIFNKSCRNVYF